MINKRIFKIALDTKNFGNLKKYTHSSKLKNSLCGDEIKIYLLIKKNRIKEFKYEGNSCIYCQASASLFSKISLNKSIGKVKNFTKKAKSLFENKSIIPDATWKVFLKIMNKKNSHRKNCLLLPLKATEKALKN